MAVLPFASGEFENRTTAHNVRILVDLTSNQISPPEIDTDLTKI
jgi:hypothetical protein